MSERPSIRTALAISAAAATCGSFLGGLIFNVYLIVRWSFFPFQGPATAPWEPLLALVPMTLMTASFAAMFALPLTLVIGSALALGLPVPIRRHAGVACLLLVPPGAALGAWFAPQVDTPAAAGAFVGGMIASTFVILVRRCTIPASAAGAGG